MIGKVDGEAILLRRPLQARRSDIIEPISAHCISGIAVRNQIDPFDLNFDLLGRSAVPLDGKKDLRAVDLHLADGGQELLLRGGAQRKFFVRKAARAVDLQLIAADPAVRLLQRPIDIRFQRGSRQQTARKRALDHDLTVPEIEHGDRLQQGIVVIRIFVPEHIQEVERRVFLFRPPCGFRADLPEKVCPVSLSAVAPVEEIGRRIRTEVAEQIIQEALSRLRLVDDGRKAAQLREALVQIPHGVAQRGDRLLDVAICAGEKQDGRKDGIAAERLEIDIQRRQHFVQLPDEVGKEDILGKQGVQICLPQRERQAVQSVEDLFRPIEEGLGADRDRLLRHAAFGLLFVCNKGKLLFRENRHDRVGQDRRRLRHEETSLDRAARLLGGLPRGGLVIRRVPQHDAGICFAADIQ